MSNGEAEDRPDFTDHRATESCDCALCRENDRLAEMAKARDDVIFSIAEKLRDALKILERYEDEMYRPDN